MKYGFIDLLHPHNPFKHHANTNFTKDEMTPPDAELSAYFH